MSNFPPYPSNNPYASPVGQPQYPRPPHDAGAAAAKNQLLILGIIYIALGAFGLLGALFFGGSNLAMLLTQNVQPPQNAEPGQAEGFYVGFYGSIIVGALSLILQPLIVIGGINMIRMKGISVARIASIVMVVPCLTPCCVVGIPFGIWGLIALNMDSVKRNMK